MTTCPPAAFAGAPLGARASDRALSALGALCLKAFLAAQFLSLTRLFFIQHLGEGFAAIATQAGLLSVALLLPAAVIYGMEAGSLFGRLVPPARAWVAAVLWLSACLFAYGWLGQGYALSAAVHDLAPYLVIVSSVVLGSMPRVWEDTDGLLVALFAAALVVNAAGMTEMTRVVSETFAEDRAGVSTVAYRTQGALAFWPWLLLTARARRHRTVALVFTGVFFVLAQQVLFQKRAPILRVALLLLVFLVALPPLWTRAGAWSAARVRRLRGLFLGTAALAATAARALAPWLFRGQLSGLAQRLSGQAYSGGPAAMLTWENERFFEAGMFLSTVGPLEVAIGRGFGGYFVPDSPGWGVWLDDLQEFGRRQLHVGLLMPFFKGGLALSLAYYAGVVLALWRGRRALRQPLGAAAFFIVLVHALFLLQEGWFIMSVSFDLVMVGLCLGYLLSSRGIGVSPPPRRPWRTA